MTELAIAGAALSSTESLTFQVFSGCIQAYEQLCHARDLPEDYTYLRVRLKAEQYRLLDWADSVRIDEGEEELLLSNSSKALLFDILDRQRRLLIEFGRKRYKELRRPLLVDYVNDDVQESTDATRVFQPDSSHTETLVNSDYEASFSRNSRLLEKSLGFARERMKTPAHARWVAFDKKKFEMLIEKLTSLNDCLCNMLNRSQLDDMAMQQTRTEFQMRQLNASVQNLISIFNPSQPSDQNSDVPEYTLKDPLRDILRAKGLTGLAYNKNESGVPSPDSLRQTEELKSQLLEKERAMVHPKEYEYEVPSQLALGSQQEYPRYSILHEGHDRQASEKPPISKYSSHMLSEDAGRLSQMTWRGLIERLPESLRLGLQFNDMNGMSCWTYTTNPAFTPTSIPLTIAGIPVVIPLKYRYPVIAPSGTPPDPYPFKIDPDTMVNNTIIDAIFTTFNDILGFYIFINGFLQLLIPEDYDLKDALRRYPTHFGHLKVSYVPFCVLSTGSENEAPVAETSSPTKNASIDSHLLEMFERTATWAAHSASRIRIDRTISSSTSIYQLEFSSTLRARILKQRSPSWFGGKPGVLTRKGSKQFLTFSTHVATKALEEAKHKISADESWTERVEVYHGNSKVGNICQTFDPFASEHFPDGIKHDVSLVDVSDKSALILARLKAPKECRWLSNEEWISMRFTKTNIRLLGNDHMRGKTIPLSESREQIVGQGIFKNIQENRTRAETKKARSRGESPIQQIHKWSSMVSRAVLYRVDPDFGEPRSNSGTAVCVIDEETGAYKVAGFQSFVQETDGGQYYELEEDPFLDMLRLGSVSFYGAFEVPEGFCEGFEIVTED